jgi:hypothetical protein
MALNRIERWTRQVLEVEARKRGIRDPQMRSHAELARMILRHDYASTHSLRSARKLVGTWLDTASSALPLGLGRAPLPAADTRHSRPSTHGESQRRVAPPVASPLPVAVPSPAPSAELNVGLQAEAVAAEARPFTFGPEHLEHSRPEPRELHLRWQVSEHGAAKARSLLGAPGELAVRIVSVRADPAHVVQSDITEHGPIENPGEWTAQLASDDTHCVTAVGLRSAGRFVSIVHRSSRPKSTL